MDKVFQNQKLLKIIVLAIVFVFPVVLFSKSNSEELFNLSFEDLMSTKVKTGSLLYMSNYDKPAMVTTISSDEIRYTPHRHLLDLLEVYVPGAMYMTHYDANSLGFRGIISDRNNKVLLMVNGRVANEKARTGAVSELENWDLSDIDRIEIIRGPGSVTYGPGAISSVINIITKTKESNDASDIRLNYVYPYFSKGLTAKFSNQLSKDVGFWGYFSFRQTDGYEIDKAYSIMNNNPELNPKESGYKFQEYLIDYFNIPQKKIHLQFDFYENFKFWVRYTNSGTTANGAEVKTNYLIDIDSNNIPLYGDYKNRQQTKHEHFYATLESEFELNEDFTLNSLISWDSENNSRTYGWFWIWQQIDAPPEDIRLQLIDHNSVRNKYNNYSESELLSNFILRGNLNDELRIAAGTSLSYNIWGAPWFENDNQLRMGDRSNIISGPDSPIYGNPLYFGVDSADAVFVGSGWSTFMYSLFAELEYKAISNFKLLFSARLDKDSYSEFLLSPRFAAIFNLNEHRYLKLIAQQSNRMNTAEELFWENRAGNTSSPEKLNTVELIFSTTEFDKIFIEGSVFYNNIDILSWYDPLRTTRLTGNLANAGIELEIKYNTTMWAFGINHSSTKLLNWKLAENINKSGISYSDYKMSYKGNQTFGYGNNLNNWNNHSTKLFTNVNLFDKKLIIHLNARVFWGFEGSKDGLEVVKQLAKGTEEEQQIYKVIDFMNKNDFYNIDFRLNASVNYRFIPQSVLSVNFMNITDITNNYRYKYEAGNKADEYLFRMNLIQEPFMIGLQLSYEF